MKKGQQMKYRIKLVESERGWGQEYWYEEYNTRGEALARIQNVNDQNTANVAPDYYVAAFHDIEVVE